METGHLVHNLQERLSKALEASGDPITSLRKTCRHDSRETEWKRALAESESKEKALEAEIQDLNGVCSSLRQGNQRLSVQLQNAQRQVEALVQVCISR